VATPRPETVEREQPTRVEPLWTLNLFLLFQGQAVSAVGTALFQVALLLWILEATGSATLMGLVMMAGTIPGVVLGPIGGVVADRVSRKALIVWGDAVLGTVMLTLAVPFFFFAEHTTLIVGWLFAVACVNGTVQAFFRPAVMAAMPDMVATRRLDAANSWFGASAAVAQVLGQAIGGVLFRTLGAPALVLINGVTFLLSALSETFIRLPTFRTVPQAGRLGRKLAAELIEGLRYAMNERGLVPLTLIFTTLNLLTVPIAIALPIMVRDDLGLSADWYGYALAALGAGSLLGFAVVGNMALDGARRHQAIVLGSMGIGLGMGTVAFIENGWMLVVSLFVVGIMLPPINVSIMTLLQSTTPQALRGRVMSLVSTLTGAAIPLSAGLAGVLIDALDQDVRLVIRMMAAGTLLTALLFLMLRNVRHFTSTVIEVRRGAT